MPDFGTPFSGLSLNRKLTQDELLRALRFFVAAEYEAVQMYMQVSDACEDPKIAETIKDIAEEEIVHAGEFLALIKEVSPEEENFYRQGDKETRKILDKKGFTEDQANKMKEYMETVREIRAHLLIRELDKIANDIEKEEPLVALHIDKITDRIQNK